MSKDAYYFSHDANARNDQKILEIRMKYGMRGYGIYFGIVEILREANAYQLPSKCSQIAYDLREPKDDVHDIIHNYNLFEFTEDGNFFYSASLKRRMERLENIRTKRKESGKKGGEASAKSRIQANAQANVKQMLNDCSSSKPIKVKEILRDRPRASANAQIAESSCLSPSPCGEEKKQNTSCVQNCKTQTITFYHAKGFENVDISCGVYEWCRIMKENFYCNKPGSCEEMLSKFFRELKFKDGIKSPKIYVAGSIKKHFSENRDYINEKCKDTGR